MYILAGRVDASDNEHRTETTSLFIKIILQMWSRYVFRQTRKTTRPPNHSPLPFRSGS